jgi:hypothetical protein
MHFISLGLGGVGDAQHHRAMVRAAAGPLWSGLAMGS